MSLCKPKFFWCIFCHCWSISCKGIHSTTNGNIMKQADMFHVSDLQLSQSVFSIQSFLLGYQCWHMQTIQRTNVDSWPRLPGPWRQNRRHMLSLGHHLGPSRARLLEDVASDDLPGSPAWIQARPTKTFQDLRRKLTTSLVFLCLWHWLYLYTTVTKHVQKTMQIRMEALESKQ